MDPHVDPAQPKMPRFMVDVYKQIHAHPDAAKRKEYEIGIYVAETGVSWTTKQNNTYMRKIWRYLYINGPKP